MSQQLIDSLKQLYPLSDELQTRIGGMLNTKIFRKKEYLLEVGQMSNHIYYIEKGLVRIYYIKDGVELCSGLLCEGQFPLSVNSFFGRTASQEFIQALEETTVHFISFNDLERLYKDFIEFNVVGRLLITQHYMLSEERNALLRKQTAQEKFELLQKNLGHLLPRVPRKDIASYLGITLETLSRLGY